MVQIPSMGHQQQGAPSLQQQQQQLIIQRQQQAAAAAGSLQARPPAKQTVAMARPAAGFSSGAVRPPTPAPVAGQTANKPPVSSADMVPAAKRKKRKLMETGFLRRPSAFGQILYIITADTWASLRAVLAKPFDHIGVAWSLCLL